MTILVSGYSGFGNVGDELVLAGLIHGLRKKSQHLAVLSARPRDTSAAHRVRATERWNIVSVLRELWACQAVISGGGGLLQDFTGRFTPAYYLGILAAAQWRKKPNILLGQGFGPLHSRWNYTLARWVLRKADLIVPRDPEGLQWCRQLGVSPDRLVLGADLAWLLPAIPVAAGPRRIWSVCLRADWLNHRIPEWIKPLWDEAQKRRRRLRFIALGNRGDRELQSALQAQPEMAGCEWINTTFGSAPQAFSGSELVVSMRYHGVLLGAQAGALVLGLGSDEKLRHLLRDLGQPMAETHHLTDGIQTLLRHKSMHRRRMQQGIRQLQQRAQAGMDAAMAVLRGKD